MSGLHHGLEAGGSALDNPGVNVFLPDHLEADLLPWMRVLVDARLNRGFAFFHQLFFYFCLGGIVELQST